MADGFHDPTRATLLDCERHHDHAVFCGYDGCEDGAPRIEVSNLGKPWVSVTLSGADGEVSFVSVEAIRVAAEKMNAALRMAENASSRDLSPSTSGPLPAANRGAAQ